MKGLKVNQSNFRKLILDFPRQFSVGMKAAKNIFLKRPKKIFIAGMGGSVLSGEILKIYFENAKIKFPLFLHRDYQLPYLAEKKDLIIAISYSGNTEETISAFNEALKKKLKLVAITSGGKLSDLCQKNKIPLVLLPSGIPPRLSLGYQFSALLKIMINLEIAPDCSDQILNLEKKLKPRVLENQGKILAKKLINKIPLIYSSWRNFALSYIWKIKFNENSKTPAFANFFPELNHNEMVGFEKNLKKFYFLILKDQNDHPRIKKRMDLTSEILKAKGLEGEILEIKGENFFEKIFSNLILADWVSYYLAIHYGIDPTPVKIVEEFKKKMEYEK